MTDPDYAALAAQAEKDHRAANERFQEAKTASETSAFRQVVFAAAAAGVTTINLEPSDQGDHMSLTDVEPEELHTNELDNELWDGISDLSDYTQADWIAMVGVTVDGGVGPNRDQINTASIDVKAAAEALLFEAEIREAAKNLGAPYDDDEN